MCVDVMRPPLGSNTEIGLRAGALFGFFVPSYRPDPALSTITLCVLILFLGRINELYKNKKSFSL